MRHLWNFHSTDRSALFYYTHKYCDINSSRGDILKAESESSAEIDNMMNTILKEDENVENLPPPAFNFNIARLQGFDDDAGVSRGEFASTKDRKVCYRGISYYSDCFGDLKIPQPDRHNIACLLGPSLKSFDPCQVPQPLESPRK